MEECSEEQDFKKSIQAPIAFDTLVTVGVWLAFLADRFGSAYASQGLMNLPQEELWHLVAVGVSSAELTILVLAVLRVIRNMAGLVDSFCSRFWGWMDYHRAVGEWNILQATGRVCVSTVVPRASCTHPRVAFSASETMFYRCLAAVARVTGHFNETFAGHCEDGLHCH